MEPIDIRDLVGRPGASRRVEADVEVGGLESEVARLEGPVHVAVLLESIVEGIYVTGPVTARMRVACARCLKPFERGVAAQVAELFAPEPDDDVYPLGEDTIDLEPMVRDAVGLAMPFAPLCREDCAGLCERCGGDRNLDECSCGPRVDPRWAALSDLKLD